MSPARISEPYGERLLNRIDFHAAFISPAISLLQQPDHLGADGPYRRRIFDHFATGMLLEAFGWLELGGAFGYFDVPDTWGLLEGIRSAHFRTMGDYVRDWGHLWDSVWIEYLASLIENPRALKPPFQLSADEQSLGVRLFEAWYTRCQDLNRSSSASHAIAVLSFDELEAIRRRSQRHSGPEEIAEAARSESNRPTRPSRTEAESPATLFLGFSRMTDLLADLHRLNEELLTEHRSNRDFVTRFVVKASQLMRWRFFFLESQSHLDWFLDCYLDGLNVKEPESRTIAKARLLQVASDWKRLTAPPARRVGA